MGSERHVRIFKNGRSRAVRIPKEFDIFGDELVIREEDGRLVLEPPKKRDLRDALAWLRAQPPLPPDEDFPEIEDLPPEPVDFP
jgi:antitoxin VapB